MEKERGRFENMLSSRGKKGRKRLDGGGRKSLSERLEEQVFAWILERRTKRLRVSLKLIMKKAKVRLQFI